MSLRHRRPVTDFRNTVQNAKARFIQRDGITYDPQTSLMYMAGGAATLYFQADTDTVHLVFVKNATDLIPTKVINGKKTVSQEQYNRWYHVASCRLEYDPDSPKGRITKNLDERLACATNIGGIEDSLFIELDSFLREGHQRILKHFKFHGMRLTNQGEYLKQAGINTKTDTYHFGSNDAQYLIDQKKDGDVETVLSIPTHREDGHFKEYDSTDPPKLTHKLDSASTTLHITDTFEEAVSKTHNHILHASQIIWDEKSAYSIDGKALQTRAWMKDKANQIIADRKKTAFEILYITWGFSLINPDYTVRGALVGTLMHIALALSAGGLFSEATKREEKAKKRPEITDYKPTENSTDAFRQQKNHRIANLYAHPDINKLPPHSLEHINFGQFNIYKNSMHLGPYKTRDTAEELITNIQQRGVTSIVYPIDDNTQLSFFYNGIIILQHYNEFDQKHVYFAQYHPGLCKSADILHAKKQIEQLKGRTICFGVDEQGNTLHDRLGPTQDLDLSTLIKEALDLVVFRSIDTREEVVQEVVDLITQSFSQLDKNTFQLPLPISARNLNAPRAERWLHYQNRQNRDHKFSTFGTTPGEEERRLQKRWAALNNQTWQDIVNGNERCIATKDIDTISYAYTRQMAL